jgi:hypothetical protein
MGAFHRNLVVLVLAAALAMLGLAPSQASALPGDVPPGIIPTSASTTTAPQPGDTLMESPAATWGTPPASTSIQWLDCGLVCVSASGPGSTTSTYTVAASDVGFRIEVQETGTYLIPPPDTQNSGPTLAVVPANTAPPAISGTPDVGQPLTAGGTWNPPQSTIAYQWIHCTTTGCLNISNTNSPTYTVAVSDIGDTIEVQETATYNGVQGAPALSAPIAVTVPSSTSLLALPANPITNQTTSLVATVTSTVAVAFPKGSVSFQDAGTPIAGCSAVPVATLNQSMQVTCQTELSASSSPEALTAVFTPNGNAGVTGSTSQTVNLAVGHDSTTTALDVSNPVVIAGRTATYTATVAPAHAGAFYPTGGVQFLDGGKPISACLAQPLQVSQGFDSAQCTVHYAKVGAHSISAIYSGDGGFNGSASSSQAVSVRRLPVHILGTIVAKMGWLFRFAPKYTQILSLLLHKPAVGTTILLQCHGVGCPFAHRSIRVAKVRACQSAGKHCVMIKPAKLQLATKFGRRRLHVGTVVTIELTGHNWIGKAYVFWVRARRGPRDRISCLAPGSTRPGVGC